MAIPKGVLPLMVDCNIILAISLESSTPFVKITEFKTFEPALTTILIVSPVLINIF